VASLCYFLSRQLILYALLQTCLWRRDCIFYITRRTLTATLLRGEYINSKQTLCASLWNQMLNQYVFPVLCSSFIVLWANEPKNETSPLRHTPTNVYHISGCKKGICGLFTKKYPNVAQFKEGLKTAKIIIVALNPNCVINLYYSVTTCLHKVCKIDARLGCGDLLHLPTHFMGKSRLRWLENVRNDLRKQKLMRKRSKANNRIIRICHKGG
jgi:hypothetical protein